jgi:hypothetical protein
MEDEVPFQVTTGSEMEWNAEMPEVGKRARGWDNLQARISNSMTSRVEFNQRAASFDTTDCCSLG